MANSNFVEVISAKHFQDLLSADLDRVSVINFYAPWAEPCKQMNEVVQELSGKYPSALFLQVCCAIDVFSVVLKNLVYRYQLRSWRISQNRSISKQFRHF